MSLQGPQQCRALGYAQCFPKEGRQEGRREGRKEAGREGRREGTQILLFALGRRPLGCAGRAGEVLQRLAELKWASAQGCGPSPWACRSPPSPPCLSSGLCCPALWQLLAAPDLLPGLPCHLGSQGHRTPVAEGGGEQSPPLLQTRPPTAGGCCAELSVLPNQEDQRGGAGPGGVTVARPGLPPPTPNSAPKEPGAERSTPGVSWPRDLLRGVQVQTRPALSLPGLRPCPAPGAHISVSNKNRVSYRGHILCGEPYSHCLPEIQGPGAGGSCWVQGSRGRSWSVNAGRTLPMSEISRTFFPLQAFLPSAPFASRPFV